MKHWLSHTIGWLLGLFFIYLAFRNQDFETIYSSIQTADYRWPMLILAISIGVHFIRAWRWAMLIEPLGQRVSVYHCFLGIMVGYVVNLGVPRLGELTRCAVVQKNNPLPFTSLLGTVITERAVDIACLLLAFGMAVALQWQKVADLTLVFISSFWQKIYHSLPFLVGFVIMVGLALYWFWKIRLLKKTASKLANIWSGVCSVLQLRRPVLFLFLTLVVWCAYFFMTYLWFFSFKESEGLPLVAGLVFMTFGSLGRSLPIQGGGIGAYHYVFTQVALIYGISQSVGLAMATLNHGLQIIYYLVVGTLCAALYAFSKPAKT